VRAVRTYLQRTIYHLYLDHLRHQSRHGPLDQAQLEPAHADPADSAPAGPGRPRSPDAIEQWVTLHDLKTAIAGLSERHQQVLWFAAHEATGDEIAAGLGLPTRGAALVTVHRARKALIRALSTTPAAAPATMSRRPPGAALALS